MIFRFSAPFYVKLYPQTASTMTFSIRWASKCHFFYCKLIKLWDIFTFSSLDLKIKVFWSRKRVNLTMREVMKQHIKVRLNTLQPRSTCITGHVFTYFSSTNCFWYSSYSSRVIPAALAGSDGVDSSSLSPPPPRPIPDRGFPIMLLIKKAISRCVYSAMRVDFGGDRNDMALSSLDS